MADKIVAFPQELRDDNNNYPHITFTVISGSGQKTITRKAISLYMPPGISINDSMSYNNINLGALGSALINNMDRNSYNGMASAFQQVSQGMGEQAGKMLRRYGQQVTPDMAVQAGSSLAAIALANKLPGGTQTTRADLTQYAFRKVVNPFPNTAFTGVNVRSFSFSFKLMAESAKDSESIRDIVESFRVNMYPETFNGAADSLLNYPSRFKIQFYDGADENPSRHIPKLINCYLVSMETSYNQSTNMFFEDGSPAEVDIQLTFQEERALTREDIVGGNR
jgi:hypothetical protein